MSERGQISAAAVALVLALLLGAAVLLYLGRIAAGGAQAQRAADLSALAAVRVLADQPGAAAQALDAAAAAAKANGARLVSLRPIRADGLVRGFEATVAVMVDGRVPGAGAQSRSVVARARAGVSYDVRLPPAAFRPVDLRGLRGRGAVVAAAEAQLGWPYVWGGESRAEGGFDCSGLVDFAYAAAGAALPGRPTAAELYRLAAPIAAPELEPGDLTFLGAASGAPYHVAIYAGSGLVVVARHRGEPVSLQPLDAVAWDGFGRLLPAGSDETAAAADPALAAARRHGVAPDVVAAELRLGLAADAERAARELAAAQARHHGNLAAALSDVLGDRSEAALVLRQASGPGLGDGFSASVRLLRRPRRAPAAVAIWNGHAAVAPAPPRTPEAPRRPGLGGAATALLDGAEHASAQLAERGAQGSLQAVAALRHGLRLGLTGAAFLLPDDRLRAVANVAGSAWDAASASADAVAAWTGGGAFALEGFGLLAARLSLAGALVGFAFSLRGALRASDARTRAVDSALALGYGLTAAGFATGGMPLLTLGAASAAIPPVGLTLLAVGGVIVLGAVAYQNAGALGRGAAFVARRAGRAWRAAAGAARAYARAGRRAAKSLRSTASRARSLISDMTPW